jgi:hypothetical protein
MTVFMCDSPVFLGVFMFFQVFREVSGKRLPLLNLKVIVLPKSRPKAA